MNRHNGNLQGLAFGLALIVLGNWLIPAVAGNHAQPAAGAQEPASVDAELLQAIVAGEPGVMLIDARSPDEYAERHVAAAVNVPYDQVDEFSAVLPADPTMTIVVHCRSGRRAVLLKDELDSRGYSDVRVLPHDLLMWNDNSIDIKLSD